MTQAFNILKKTNTIIIFLLILLVTLHLSKRLLVRYSFTSKTVQTVNSTNLALKLLPKTITYPHTIVVAIVVCVEPLRLINREEGAVLLKSIIISAKLNKIRSVEVYFFFENVTRERDFFIEKIKEFGYPFEGLRFAWHFKSAIETMPAMYRETFFVEPNGIKCRNIKNFLPNSLPYVDSILYLDTDVIIHGNLANLWKILDSMNDKQIIGVSSDYQDGNVVQHPHPRELNSGVLLMNLTRMRQFGWEDKIAHILFDFDKVEPRFLLSDQMGIRVLLDRNPNLLFHLPCQFNFMNWLCKSNACQSVSTDGIQLIHGAGGHMFWPGVFRNVFLAYQNANLTNCMYERKLEFRDYIQNEFERLQNRTVPLERVKEVVRECESVLSLLWNKFS